MSFKVKLAAAAIALTTSFSAKAQECDTSWVNVENTANVLAQTPTEQWNKGLIGSFGKDKIRDMIDYTQATLPRALSRNADRVLDTIDRADKRQRPVDWDGLKAQSHFVFHPIIDSVKAQKTTTLDARTQASVAVSQHVAKVLETLNAIPAAAPKACLTNPPAAPAPAAPSVK